MYLVVTREKYTHKYTHTYLLRDPVKRRVFGKRKIVTDLDVNRKIETLTRRTITLERVRPIVHLVW